VRPGGEEELDCGFCGEDCPPRSCGAGRRCVLGGVLRSLCFAAVVTSVMADDSLSHLSDFHQLLRAARRGDMPNLRRALAAGADPNMSVTHSTQHTPLLSAARQCRPEAVTVLLSAGARADFVTDQGNTPLLIVLRVNHKGSERDHRTIVNALISAGANVNVRNNMGQSPFGRALDKGLRSILLDLLRAGAEVDTVSRSGLVPATDTEPSFERTIEVRRAAINASAWALVDAIKKAGDFDEYARRQLNVHISMLTKCFGTAMPLDAWSHVAGFYAPRGFY